MLCGPPGKPPGSRSGQSGKAKNEQMLFGLPPESGPPVCAFMSTRSKASADAQLHVVAFEIVEIERARSSRHRAPDLNVPRGRDEVSFAEGRVESRADVERLPGETIEAEPVVVTKVARFRADKDVRHYLHCERRSNPERGLAQGLPRPAQPRLFRLVADIERGE